VPFTICICYVINVRSDMKSEGNMLICARKGSFETTTANFFGCYLLSSSVDRYFLCLCFITFEPHPNPVYSPKCNKTQTFMSHFFFQMQGILHSCSPFPLRNAQAPWLCPQPFHLHLKWLQTGLSANWMEKASTVFEL